MKRSNIIRESLDQNLSGVYVSRQQQMDMIDEITGGKKLKRRIPVSFALAAVILLMTCTAYAFVHSALLEHLFPGGGIRDDAYQYLLQEQASAEDGGVTLTVDETLFDGRSIHVSASIRNDTAETLFVAATMARVNGIEPDSYGGDFLFNYGIDYLAIAPGETISGYTYSNYLPETFEGVQEYTVSMEAYAMRAIAEIPPREDGRYTDLYSANAFTTENSRQAAYLSLTYQVNGSLIHTATYTRVKQPEYRMDGCTLIVKEANFTPSATHISFEIVADDPADAYADQFDSSKDGRLLRWYAIFDDQGNRLDDIAEGGGEYSASDDGAIEYVYDFGPLSEAPSSISIVPIENGDPAMEKAVTVEIVPAERPIDDN